jgi:predicted AlkP superfamily pyrophosphatase or phosphodiesterase
MKPILKRIATGVLGFALASSALALAAYGQPASGAPAVITTDHGPNAAQQLAKHYVILVSLDGFRYDYARRYHARNLLALGSAGASAPEGMLPAYPSITFPNHYTIVTGLYPEHHGIVANTFYDPERKEVYSYHDAKTVADGSWYGGTPLWVLAEQQGMRSACFFWVGSEADIQGVRPSYYLKYESTAPNSKRVEQVLAWLHLPAEQRPHMITLYFSDTDTAGHRYGPDSPEVAEAVGRLDRQIGMLVEGIKGSKLPVDLIVLSDHGMAEVNGPTIDLGQYGLDRSWFARTVGSNLYPKSDEDAEKSYEALLGKNDHFLVYRRKAVPAYLHFDSNAREGDPVVVPTGAYLFDAFGGSHAGEPAPKGMHGYDATQMPEMKAIFFAAGPDIKRGIKLKSFENVDVYPLIARILDLDITKLKTGPIDGKIDALGGILKAKPTRGTAVVH